MINIVLSSDDSYIPYCSTTMLSIVSNNDACSFYIISEHLNEDSKQKLLEIAKQNGSSATFITIPPKLLDTLPMPKSKAVSHISLATYYRLFIADLLPQDVDKVLYLDCDILVRKSLVELWNTPLDDFALGAVYQINSEANERCYALGISVMYGYFNAGVLLINLQYWRQHNCSAKFLLFIKQQFERIFYHDQDILNAVLFDKTKRLSCKWNMTTNLFRNSVYYINEKDKKGNIVRKNEDYKKTIRQEVKDPAIIHFVTSLKPWNPRCFHPWKREYIAFFKKAGYCYEESKKYTLLFYIVKIARILKLDLL